MFQEVENFHDRFAVLVEDLFSSVKVELVPDFLVGILGFLKVCGQIREVAIRVDLYNRAKTFVDFSIVLDLTAVAKPFDVRFNRKDFLHVVGIFCR